MRSLLTLSLLALVPIVAAASNLVAVSTLPGFLCGDSQSPKCENPLPQSLSLASLPSLLHHLSSRTTQAGLPLAETSTAPELVVLITSRNIANPASLLDHISKTVNGASSFHATTDRDASEADLWELSARSMSSVDKLVSFASDSEAHKLRNGASEIVTIAAKEDDEALFQTLRTLAERTAGKLAILWTTREETQEDTKEDAAAPVNPPEEKDAAEDQSAAATEKTLNPPEINTAQLTGLLVTLLFLMIFIPGFMCLWNIQPPQSFEIFDTNDMKKKMQ